MLDGKVLTAVFASLAAIGAAMSGGAVDSADLQPENIDSSTDFNVEKYLPKSLDILRRFNQKPEPTTEIKAVLEVNGLQNQEIQSSKGSLYAQNITSADIGGREIDSDDDIIFYGYTGKILPGKPSKIDGRAEGVLTSNVNVSGRFRTEQEFETDIVYVKNVERTELSLKDINGDIESDSTSTQIKDSNIDLEINSFSGNITVRPENSTVELSGKVDKLSAGDVSFGN